MLLLAAVYCRFLISFSLPAGMDWETWVRTASAWEGFAGEVDKQGRLVHQFGPYNAGKLTLRYDPSIDYGTVRGSLQSYWHGSNALPFGWPDVPRACQSVADALQLPPALLRVSTLETGLTVAMEKAPTAFLSQVARAHYGPQQTPFYGTEPPANCPQPLQFVARTNEIRVKVYDKGTYARMRNNPLPATGQGFRFELHYLKSRRLGAALGWDGAITWANLMQADVYESLAARLLESWKQIHLPASMDTPNLSIDERALLIAGQYPEFWEAGKRETPPATYRRKRALFRKLQQTQAAQPETGTPYSADVERHIAAALPTAQN